MGPLLGVGRGLTIVAVAYVLYRPTDRDAVAVADTTEGGGASVEMGADQRRMLLFLLLGVAVWATDALHGLHPLYGALVVVLLSLSPRVGVIGPDEVGDVDFSIVFFIGAIFAVAEGLRRTEFTDLAARGVLSTLPGDASLPLVLGVVVVVAIALTFVMEGLAVASVLTPILVSSAAGAGIPIEPVAMIEAAALNTYFFPYQSAGLVAILGLDVVDAVELVRMATVCSLVTLLVVIPAQIGLFAVAF
jgi:di/tricarboxylate transporter